MPGRRFELLRVPLAVLLIALAVIALWPRGQGDGSSVTPGPSILVGELGGEVLTSTDTSAPSQPTTPIPTLTPLASPTPSPTATPAPADDGFTAEVLACRSISGSTCHGRLGTLPPSAGTFTALVRFTDAVRGDQISTVLDGPSGTIDGFPYTLQGGGDGYYYSEFQAGSLPAGEYTLTATRNGEVVARTAFRKAG